MGAVKRSMPVMRVDQAADWVATHAVIVQGYYIDGRNGQPNPEVVYCRKHADEIARRLTRETRVEHYFCEAWGGSDTVERCGVSSCSATLDSGGLTDYGIRTTLGMDEENPLAFVADVHELEMVRRAIRADHDASLEARHLQSLWLSQVLRLQKGVTQKQCLAFEAAWLAGDVALALDLLRKRERGRIRA